MRSEDEKFIVDTFAKDWARREESNSPEPSGLPKPAAEMSKTDLDINKRIDICKAKTKRVLDYGTAREYISTH